MNADQQSMKHGKVTLSNAESETWTQWDWRGGAKMIMGSIVLLANHFTFKPLLRLDLPTPRVTLFLLHCNRPPKASRTFLSLRYQIRTFHPQRKWSEKHPKRQPAPKNQPVAFSKRTLTNFCPPPNPHLLLKLSYNKANRPPTSDWTPRTR